MGGQWLQHPGVVDDSPFEWSDLDVLSRCGLTQVLQRQRRHAQEFIVSPRGWEYWETLQREKGGATERVEAHRRRLVDSRPARGPYAPAFEKWATAEALLWTAQDQPGQLTNIGHLCREAMQLFADAFATTQGRQVDENVAYTVVRVRAGLDAIRPRVSETLSAFLDALPTYWGTVADLVQRLEHGAAKEGRPIDWEDARLEVVQTMMVMSELIRAAARLR